MSAASAPSPELVSHLEKAAIWRLLAQVLSYPDEGWPRRMELLAACVRDSRLAALGRTAAREGSPELWMRLFGPSGPVRVRAVAWEGGLQPGYLLAELEAYYSAFGYQAPAAAAPDALPALLDFAAWMEMKLAYASVHQDREAVEVTRQALESFLKRFVSTVAWAVFRQLENAGPEFLASAARAAALLSGPEPARHAPAPDAWPDGSPLEDGGCAAQDGIVQINPR